MGYLRVVALPDARLAVRHQLPHVRRGGRKDDPVPMLVASVRGAAAHLSGTRVAADATTNGHGTSLTMYAGHQPSGGDRSEAADRSIRRSLHS